MHYGAGRDSRLVSNPPGSASRTARPSRPPDWPNRLARRTLDRDSAWDLPAGSAGRLASAGRRIAPESPAPVTPRARLAGMAARLARTHIPLDLPPYLACPARVANTAARLGRLARTMTDPGRQARPARPPPPADSHHSYNTDPAIYKRTSADTAPTLSCHGDGSTLR